MKASPFWIDAGPGRRLRSCPVRRGGDWLSDEIAAWKRAGFTSIVSLLTPEEESSSIFEMKQACPLSPVLSLSPLRFVTGVCLTRLLNSGS